MLTNPTSDIGQMCKEPMYPAMPNCGNGHVLYSSKHAGDTATAYPNLQALAAWLNDLTKKSGVQQISARVLPNPTLECQTWADTLGLAPSNFLRTGIFSTPSKENRGHLHNEILPTACKNTLLIVNGDELSQNDLDVWMQAIRLCRFHTDVSQTATVEIRPLLRKLGYKTIGGKDAARLQTSLSRLANYAFAWIEPANIYLSTMLHYDQASHTVSLPHPIAYLINNNGYTLLDLSSRQALTSARAKWLQAFWATHTKPKPYNLKTLMKFCPSHNVSAKSDLQQWKYALNELVEKKVFQQVSFTPTGLVEITLS